MSRYMFQTGPAVHVHATDKAKGRGYTPSAIPVVRDVGRWLRVGNVLRPSFITFAQRRDQDVIRRAYSQVW